MADGRSRAKQSQKSTGPPNGLDVGHADVAQAAGLAETILASTPDCIYLFDRELRYRFASLAGAKTLGLSQDKIIGRTWRELGLPPEIMEPFEREILTVFASGGQVSGATDFPLPNGTGHYHYLLAPVRDRVGRVESVVCSCRDDTANWQLRSALNAIGHPVRSATGDAYLRELVVRLSNVLGLRYAFIGELPADECGRVQSVAVAENGALVDNIDYDLAGTPCENVIGGSTCCYPSGVQRLFPRDEMLVQMGAEGYIATALTAPSGNVTGILALLDDAPIVDVETTKTVIELFAVRAGAELDRRSADARLRRSQRLLLAAERVGKSGSFEWDLSTNAVQWSPGTYELYGVDQSTAPPVTFEYAMSFVHPDDAPRVERRVREMLDGGGRSAVEYRIKRPDGSGSVVRGHGELMRDGTGKPTYLVGTVHDWSEKTEAAAALRESEDRYRSIFEHAAFGIYRSTVDGRFVAANPALVGMLGYESEDELLHANIATDIYVRAEDRQRLIEAHSFAAGVVEPVDVEWRRKDGTALTVRLRGSKAIGQLRNECFTMTAEDVTIRRRLEDQLRQTQKMEGIGRLAGGIAHDFNNILTAITAYSDMLLTDLPSEDKHRGDVEEIHRAAGRAAALTRQLLAFSRQQVLAPRVLDLETVVTGLHNMLRRIIGEDITLATDLGASGHVRADLTQVEQVLLNLVVNARDAMQSGGRVTIATADRVVGRGGVQSTPVAPGEYVTLSVTDTGIGMDAETMARAFEPFFTTKPPGAGTGLGLSTVYGVVKQSGGYVLASSTPGAGTTIDVYLPTVVATAEWPIPVVEPRRRTDGSEVILLVEDDPGVRRVAKLTLRRAGYQVLEAGTAHEALALVRGKEDAIDLVLTDVVMPGMNGRQLCEQLWLRRPDLRVVFMSGYPGGPDTRDQLLEPGAPLLAKPFTADALTETVRTELDRAAAAAAAAAARGAR